jgi:DNA-binding MarR family transcriptional regulator
MTPRRQVGAAPSRARAIALDPVLEFLRLVWALDHGLQKASKAMGRQTGVTGPQRLAIRVLGENPGLTPGELAHVLHLDPSTLTGVLRRLEQRRFIEREIDPVDARRARLRVTPSGRVHQRRNSGTIEAAVKRALRLVPARELAGTRRVLAAVATALGVDDGGDHRPRRHPARR